MGMNENLSVIPDKRMTPFGEGRKSEGIKKVPSKKVWGQLWGQLEKVWQK